MNPVETPGATLLRERQAQGVSIEELAAITRISPRLIRSLENDRYEDLPAEVFVRGFYRNCARELGLDENELLARYELQTGVRPDQSLVSNDDGDDEFAEKPVGSLFASRRSLPAAYLIAILAIILGLSLSLLIFGASEQDRFSGSHRGSDVSYPVSAPSNPN